MEGIKRRQFCRNWIQLGASEQACQTTVSGKLNVYCKFSGFHSNECSQSGLLHCDIMQFWRWLPAGNRNRNMLCLHLQTTDWNKMCWCEYIKSDSMNNLTCLYYNSVLACLAAHFGVCLKNWRKLQRNVIFFSGTAEVCDRKSYNIHVLKNFVFNYFVIVYYNFKLHGSMSCENEYHNNMKLYSI